MDSRVVFVQVAAWPTRNLIVKRTVRANDYFSYCDEVDCGVWDELKAIPGSLGEPLGLWMPQARRHAETPAYVQGVEISAGYEERAPDGFDILAFPACWMMIFQGLPYEAGQTSTAIKIVQEAMEKFDPQVYGYEWADGHAPRVHWEPMGKRGYIEARPVRPGEKLGIVHWV